MVHSSRLRYDLEKWWKNLDTPISVMDIIEGIDDIAIGDLHFRAFGDKFLYSQKTRCTATYVRTFQSLEPVESKSGEIVYPLLDVYVDICNGRKSITYKKNRVRCSC